ncbi:MAG: MogA/MoaB family molybdenum cofactor biosynthesis protein [Phycisphaerae bacterium]|jgi:molybdenum cofactor synthesis domain-containing protein|nr:MogA/MoaB family molybdenum cofactor biosynthesis protein [Phycisphaerae bacterium]
MRIAILTVSDRCSRGEAEDTSGPALAAAAARHGAAVTSAKIVPDEREQIEAVLCQWADGGEVEVVLTTGGTGIAARDVTPEATLAVIERTVPGMAEAMRAESLKITSRAMLSRAVAGTRGKCLIINLPGSPKGAVECFEVASSVLEHAVDLLAGRTAH